MTEQKLNDAYNTTIRDLPNGGYSVIYTLPGHMTETGKPKIIQEIHPPGLYTKDGMYRNGPVSTVDLTPVGIEPSRKFGIEPSRKLEQLTK